MIDTFTIARFVWLFYWLPALLTSTFTFFWLKYRTWFILRFSHAQKVPRKIFFCYSLSCHSTFEIPFFHRPYIARYVDTIRTKGSSILLRKPSIHLCLPFALIIIVSSRVRFWLLILLLYTHSSYASLPHQLVNTILIEEVVVDFVQLQYLDVLRWCSYCL